MKAFSFLKVAMAFAATGCIIFSSGVRVSAATITWTNAASGNWSNTNNWSSHVAPGPGDTAIITNVGITVTLDISPAVGGIILGTNGPGTVTLAMNSQTLTLDGLLTVNPSGSFTVDSGTLYGNTNAMLSGTIGWSAGTLGGVLTLAAGGTLNITTGNNHFCPNLTLTNNGTVTWLAGQILAGGNPGTTIVNNGLWDCQSDQTWNNYYAGNGTVFNNHGTFRKSVSTGGYTTFNSGAVFNQLAGKLDSQTNIIMLQGGGSFTGGYATNLVGFVSLNGGAFNLNGTITSTNVQLAGGTFTGNNVIAGGLNWIVGDWNNSASETIASNALLLVTTGNGHNVENCTITNYGTVTWNNGSIQGGGVPGTYVYNYGLWDCQSDQSWNNPYAGNGTVFNNYGTFRKSGSTGGNTTFPNGAVFNQLAGKLDPQTNEIVLQSGGSFTGGYATNLTGIVSLNAGAFNINGTITSTNVQLAGGTLTGNNVIVGGLNWVVGNWDNSASETIASNALLLVTSGNGHNVANCTITNYGTVAWNNGSIQGGGVPGTFVYNYGLWDCQSDQNWTEPYAGNGTVFNNYGTLRKSGGSSEFATATTFITGLVFNQLAGVIDVQNGTNGLEIAFQGGGNFLGGYITTNQFGLTVLSSGNFILNGTRTGTNTWENGGNLVGTNVINGALNWMNGNWNNVGLVTISAGSTLLVAGGGNANNMENATVINNGTVAWISGTIQGGGASPGTFIYNYGLWDCQGDQTLNGAWAGNGTVFNNLGTVRKSVGTNSSQTLIANGVVFNQPSGALNVQQGNFWLQGGGSFTGGSVAGAGLTYLSSGNFTINGTVTSSNVIENAANLIGTNVITGALNWQAGVWNGVNLTITSNSVVTVAGSVNNNDMANSWVTNYGTLAWSSGTIRGGGASPGTFIYNYGLWDCQSDQTLNGAYAGNGTTFNNYGILRKDGGGPEFSNATYFANGVLFNQSAGVIDVQNGTNGLQLAFQGGGNFTGGYITTNQFGLTVFSAGNFTVNGAVTGTNTWENAGYLVGNNVIRGGLTWISGIWNGISLTIASNSIVIIAGGVNNNDIPNSSITNYGTINWNSGILRGGGGSPGTFVYNYGLWNAQSDQIFNDAYAGNGTTFYNYGTLRKSVGADTNQTVLQSGVFVNNAGTIDSQAGWLTLQGGFSLTNGAVLNFGLNSRTNYGKLNLSGAVALIGTVSANLNNGYQPAAGSTFTNLYYGSYSGLFSSAVLPPADAWSTNYYSTNFVLAALNARPVFAPLPTNWFTIDELAAISVTNIATDVDAGQTLTYSLVTGTNGMTVNSANGIFSWTPQQTNSPSTNVVTVAVTDNGSPPLNATTTFTVAVREVNVPPSLPTNSAQTVNELTLLTVTNTAMNSNIHSTIVGYTLVGAPSNMVINASGIITWTPAQAQSPGTNLVTTIVTNSNPYDTVNPRLTATNIITVIVKEVNQPPALSSIGLQTLTLLQLFSIGNSATEPNIHSTTTGYGLVSPPAGASINASGLISWTPQPYQTRATYTITTVVTNSNPYDQVNPHLTATNSFLAVVVPNLNRTNLSMLNLSGTSLSLSWPPDHTGWRLQSQTNSLAMGLSTNWVTVSGSASTNQVIIFISQANGIIAFRMIYP